MKALRIANFGVVAALLVLALAPLAARAQDAPPQGRAVLLPVVNSTNFHYYPGFGSDESRIPAEFDFVTVAGSESSGIGLRADGSLASWGYDYSNRVSGTPAGTDFKQVAVSSWASAALRRDGSIAAWGDDWLGMVSNAPAGTGFTAIALGSYHGVALASDGSLHSWGDDFFHEVTGTPAGTDFKDVRAGDECSAAIRNDGTVAMWGRINANLGQPPATFVVRAASVNDGALVGIRPDGSLAAWGDNSWGQLDVPAGNDFVDVVLSSVGAMALRSDGSIVSWGGKYFGHSFGYTVTAPAGSVIVAIGPGGDTAFLGISVGGNHAPAKPAMPAGGVVGGVHTPYPGVSITLVPPGGYYNLDPDFDWLTYTWTDETGNVLFRDLVAPFTYYAGGYSENTISPTPGIHTYRLTVTDPFGASSSNEVTYDVREQPNQAPVADAGPDATYYLPHDGDPATNLYRYDMQPFTMLNGAAYDPDGDDIYALWTDENGTPLAGDLQAFGDAWGYGVSWWTDDGYFVEGLTAGDHTFTLTVWDTYGASSSDTVTLHIVEPNRAPTLNVPATAAVNVGRPVTVQASATDPDGDKLAFNKASGPAWATIDSATGLITLNAPAGTAGTFTVTVSATDPYGASDQKSLSVTVCPVILEAVTLSRQGSDVTVQFNVRNTSASVTVTNVSLNAATLKGVSTKTALPVLYPQLKPGVVKQVQLKFPGVPSGPAQFIVNGTSSAGPVNANMAVTVP